jgi:hypothetical protein
MEDCISFVWLKPKDVEPAAKREELTAGWNAECLWRDWDESRWGNLDWEPIEFGWDLDADGTKNEQFSWHLWETCENPHCEFFMFDTYADLGLDDKELNLVGI